MKKHILFLTISYACATLMPISMYAGEHAMENYTPTFLDKVSIGLGPQSKSFVNRWSLFGAGMGAVTGFSAGLMFSGDSSRFVIPALAGLGTGTLGYALAKRLATKNTPEKQRELTINQLVTNNNQAVTAYNTLNTALNVLPDDGVYLTSDANPNTEKRARFASLHFHDPNNVNDRMLIYKSITFEQSKMPITARVNHVARIKQLYGNEGKKVESITDDLINKTNQYGFKDISSTAFANKNFIKDKNVFYRHPNKTLNDWILHIEKLPEHKTENNQYNFRQWQERLQEQEGSIKDELAFLAALQSKIFSNINLSDNVWSYIRSNRRANRIKDEKAIKKAIATTKNTISFMVQNYQTKLLEYNNTVIDHNQQVSKIPQNVVTFMKTESGDIVPQTFNAYKANETILNYNTYLNHSDGDQFTYWINRIFA